jgi:signal transduction histidine kinase
VKFTPRGGSISVRLVEDDQVAKATISDTGVGIKRDALPHVFQRFWQGESVNGRQTGGLGLGLALARHFVELHGGSISVESGGPGNGSTFTVTLPRQV